MRRNRRNREWGGFTATQRLLHAAKSTFGSRDSRYDTVEFRRTRAYARETCSRLEQISATATDFAASMGASSGTALPELLVGAGQCSSPTGEPLPFGDLLCRLAAVQKSEYRVCCVPRVVINWKPATIRHRDVSYCNSRRAGVCTCCTVSPHRC